MKKKILTLLLAFAVVMTFMPSMVFATDYTILAAGIELTTPNGGDNQLGESYELPDEYSGASMEQSSTFQFYTNEDDDEPDLIYNTLSMEWCDGEGLTLEPEDVPRDLSAFNHMITYTRLICGENACYIGPSPKTPADFALTLKVDGNPCPAVLMDGSTYETLAATKDQPYVFTFNPANPNYYELRCSCYVELNAQPEKQPVPIKEIVKGVAAVVGIAAVATAIGVAGTAAQNAHKAAVLSYKAKMQQNMVKKQAAQIKTVLKGAGVVLSLASFGSSLNRLFQLNQFGFNPFGFR